MSSLIGLCTLSSAVPRGRLSDLSVAYKLQAKVGKIQMKSIGLVVFGST
ncbi:MAG: hypothetical protein ACI9OJ_003028 [Myxococcota bacterium]|jgi:hypothetical protein